MKKKYLFLFLIIILVSFVLGFSLNKIEKDNIVTISKNDNKLNSNIAIMYEEDGDYKSSTDGSWPDNYYLNPEKSSCKSDTTIGYDTNTDKIIFKGNHPDRCIIYFDKEITLANYIKSIFVYDGYNNIYYHDAKGDYINSDLEAEDFSYRYTGPSEDVNNYICFGSEAAICPDDSLYRIIGLFKNESDIYEAKIIKADYATYEETGTDGAYVSEMINYKNNLNFYRGKQENLSKIGWYFWNKSDNGKVGQNIWDTSLLSVDNLHKNYLNNYLKNKENGKWVDFITSNHKWYFSAFEHSIIARRNAKDTYKNEISKNNFIESQIGLIYASDYMYSALPSNWDKTGYNNDDETRDYRSSVDDNWIYMGLHEWILFACSNEANLNSRAFFIGDNGRISNNIVTDYALAIRPAMYLKSETKYLSGNGTLNNPYRIA